MSIHFISDLHLDNAKPEIGEILLRYLHGPARQARQLYLLGDIFEYWLGDDISLPQYSEACQALADLSSTGVEVLFMHGNRDFLVGPAFAEQTGITLLPDPFAVRIGDRPALLSHGDLLCTDDTEHQKFRELVTQDAVKQRLLSLPAGQREQMAQQLRGMSRSANSNKAMDIMDVNEDSVRKVMQAHEVTLLIHGHTHRCAIHDLELNNRPAQRVVLEDWHPDHGSVLVAEGDELHFETLV